MDPVAVSVLGERCGFSPPGHGLRETEASAAWCWASFQALLPSHLVPCPQPWLPEAGPAPGGCRRELRRHQEGGQGSCRGPALLLGTDCGWASPCTTEK